MQRLLVNNIYITPYDEKLLKENKQVIEKYLTVKIDIDASLYFDEKHNLKKFTGDLSKKIYEACEEFNSSGKMNDWRLYIKGFAVYLTYKGIAYKSNAHTVFDFTEEEINTLIKKLENAGATDIVVNTGELD